VIVFGREFSPTETVGEEKNAYLFQFNLGNGVPVSVRYSDYGEFQNLIVTFGVIYHLSKLPNLHVAEYGLVEYYENRWDKPVAIAPMSRRRVDGIPFPEWKDPITKALKAYNKIKNRKTNGVNLIIRGW
jgi:hypothetical protein